MKEILKYICAICLVCSLGACGDFFDPSTDDELDGDKGFTSNTEMYTGFLGIITKIQAVGDKEILLTETRGDLIEPSEESTDELIALYNYEPNLQDNSYANPKGYYEVVLACNDYLKNMSRYKSNPNADEEAWRQLISSTVRIKAWAYKTLAEIYGQAIWLDDANIDIQAIQSGDKYPVLSLEQVIDKALALLDNGYDGVPSDLDINWIAWLDPSKVNSIASSEYRKWTYIVPTYAGVYSELCLWKGAVMDAAGIGADAYYQKAADLLLAALGAQINVTSDPGSNVYWLPSAATPGHYAPIWNNSQPYPYEAVSAIIYDYTKNQTNTLLKHFSDEYPNKYWLRPAAVSQERFISTDFNPGATTNDTRYKCVFGNHNGHVYLAKFRPTNSTIRPNPYQDDCHIFIYRATQYHMMLAEALNHLRRFTAMNAVLNIGVKAGDTEECFNANSEEWQGFASTVDPTKSDWTGTANWGTRKYPSMGVRGCFGLTARPVKLGIHELGEEKTYRFNDMALLDESMLEFAAEGKVYPMMNRMAVRYNDASIVADRVCRKYTDAGLAATVRSRILDGAYWVPFNL